MLKISDFSRLTFIPAKTLRYYDEIDLFKPAKIDPLTAYRYYSIEQLPRLYRILAFKGLGLSLKQIQQLLDESLSSEQIRGMLRLKQSEIMQQLEEEQMRLTYVETMIQRIERKGNLSDYEVIVKKVDPIRVAYMNGVAKDHPSLTPMLNRLFEKVCAHIDAQGGGFAGMAITLYHDDEWTGKDIHVEAAVPVKNDLPESTVVKIRTLPGFEIVASVIHRGPFSEMHKAYDTMLEWVATNGYSICSSPRELSLQYEPDGDPSKYVTEVQFPVKKMS